MRRFIYKNEDGHIHFEAAEMDLTQVAAEIGRIANEMYSSLYRQNPEAADFFKTATVMAIAHPDSPVWKVEQLHDGGVEMVILNKKDK